MKGSILKNTGRPAAAVLLALLFLTPATAAQVDTVIRDTKISVGSSTTLQLKIADEDVTPVSIPKVPGLDISYQGMQRTFQFINGKTWKGITLNFTVTAEKRGTYRIPPFVFESHGSRIKSGEVTLVVTQGAPGVSSARPSLMGRILLSKQSAHTGEPVIMRYYILSAGVSADFRGFRSIPESKGFVKKKFEEAVDDEVVQLNGKEWVQEHVASFVLIPAGAGVHDIGGGTAVISMQVEDSIFPFNNQRALNFGTVKLRVDPLPVKGKPADFRGDAGVFTIDADYSGDPVTVFNEKRIKVTVSGKGNLLTLSRPVLEGPEKGARVLVDEGERSIQISGNDLEGARTYIFTVIPEKAGACDMGKIGLSFFNTDTLRFDRIETGTVSFNVTGADTEEDRPAFDNDDSKKIDFNPLYFIGVLIIVSGTVLLVIMWERKRYRLVKGEKDDAGHEHVAGQGERRNYAHELRAAIRAGDRDGFLRIADSFLDEIISGAERDGNTETREISGGIRERIYSYKFGGARITDDEMEKISEEVTRLAKGRS